jgi:perosamine synthetase
VSFVLSHEPISLAGTDLGDEELELLAEVVRSGFLSNGPMLARFEAEFAERLGAKHALGVSSGTAAVHLSLLATGLSDGDLVITTPFSFIASSNPILYERAVPVFVDIDPQTLSIDPARTLEAIDTIVKRKAGWRQLLPPTMGTVTGNVRAIVPVDIFGRVAEMREIVAAAHEQGIAVVEDACEALGASLDGVPAGRWGDAGTFGFYPNKQMTTGEGGLVVTDDDDIARLVRSLRSQGRSDDGSWLRHERVGYNYRLNEFGAAIGLAQLRRLDDLLSRRNEVAATYLRLLETCEYVTALPAPRAGMSASWFVFVVQVKDGVDRDLLAERLDRRGVPTRPYFWPIHLQPPYVRRFGYRRGMYPHAEAAGDSFLALPFHGRMTTAQVEAVCLGLCEEAAALASASMNPSPVS